MGDAKLSNRANVLDAILTAITRDPRRLLSLLLVLSGIAFSLLSVILGLLVFAIVRFTSLSSKVVIGVGVVLLLSSWLVVGINVASVFQYNHTLFYALFHYDLTLLGRGYVWLTAFPYGILFGGSLAVIATLKLGLHDEVKRVAQGKRKSSGNPLSERRLVATLDHLTSAAYASGTILGVDRYQGGYVFLDDKAANLHTLVVGSTGSGKTTGVANIIESAIIRRYPLFYVDGKGDLELAQRVQHFAAAQNVPFYLFSMVGESLKYNPIAFGGFTSKKDRIVELRHWSEDHYRKLAEGYLQTVFKLLARADIGLDLHSLSQYLEPDALYLLARQLNDQSLVATIEKLEGTRREISSLVAEIDNMVNSEIGHLFDCSTGKVLTLDRALADKAVVYFCLQPLAFPAYAETLGKLIINDIKSLAASRLTLAEKSIIYTIFDEFSIFAGDQIIHLINQGRSAGIHAVLSTQSLSDILRKGDQALLGQLLNNINNYIIQRQNNPEDAEILASIIGTVSAFQITSQLSVEQGSTGLGSVKESHEFIIHPDEIKRLAMGQAIVVNKQPFKVQRALLRKGAI